MRKSGLVVAAVMMLALGLEGAPASQRVPIRFPSGARILAEVVQTPESREKGLMFRKTLARDGGMLFLFPDEQDRQFWMKNTWVSLDIVFIGADKRVTRLHERVRASTTRMTDAEVARVGGPAQFVLELPAGSSRRYKLKEGRRLDFKADIPQF